MMVQKKINKLLACSALCSSLLIGNLNAAEIKTNMARLQAMDKITGRVNEIDAPVNAEVFFGSFSIVVRSCATRPPEETPENYAFVDVVDNYKTESPVNIFKGWMISSSPALNAVEHPIYDIWLLKCLDGEASGKKLSAEQLVKRDEIEKFMPIENKFNDITQTEQIKEEVQVITTEPVAVEAASEVVEVKTEAPVIVEQVVEDGAPKPLLNIVEAPSEEAPVLEADDDIVKNALKELEQMEKTDAPVEPASVEPASVEPAPVIVAEPTLAPTSEPIKVVSPAPEVNAEPITEESVQETTTELLMPEAEASAPVVQDGEQLIKFDDEIEEDGFELNSEALNTLS